MEAWLCRIVFVLSAIVGVFAPSSNARAAVSRGAVHVDAVVAITHVHRSDWAPSKPARPSESVAPHVEFDRLRALESDIDEWDAQCDVADESLPTLAETAFPNEGARRPRSDAALDTSCFAVDSGLPRGPPTTA